MRSEHLYGEWLQRADLWIAEFMDECGLTDPRSGVLCFKITLHALRDRLGLEDAARLADRLPTLVRGLFYEGWMPALTRDLEGVAPPRIQLPRGLDDDPERYDRALRHLIANYVSAGEASRLDRLLPA